MFHCVTKQSLALLLHVSSAYCCILHIDLAEFSPFSILEDGSVGFLRMTVHMWVQIKSHLFDPFLIVGFLDLIMASNNF